LRRLKKSGRMKKDDKEDFGGRKITKYHQPSAIYSQNAIEGVYV